MRHLPSANCRASQSALGVWSQTFDGEPAMLTRRNIAMGMLTCPVLLNGSPAASQMLAAAEERFDQLIYPPIDDADNAPPFGYRPATDAQKKKAADISAGAPKGPAPVDIAQSFFERFYKKDPEAITQWPAPASWNPLMLEFFFTTPSKFNSDMVAWSAAFVNWCLERSGRSGTQNSGSQSFLAKEFKITDAPQPGDLAVFTCYDKSTGRSLSFGHVAFFKEKLAGNRIRVIGGNPSADGHSSIICEREFLTTDHDVRRHIGETYSLCTMRLNSFIKLG